MDIQNTETMYDCYRSQFACLNRIYQSAADLLDDFVAYYTHCRPDRLLLVGSGTSYHACRAAAPFLASCLGIEVNVKIPTAMGRIYGEQPLAIVVSQSGRSTNTLEAVKTLRTMHIPVISLTDPIDTPVSKESDLAVWLAAENEQVGPKTRGYAATLCTLHLMALKAGNRSGCLDDDDYKTGMNDLRVLIDDGTQYIDICGRFFDDCADMLKTAAHYMFVGKGVSARAAEESALKVLETLCLPAAGYEFEEFLHGPAFCADGSMALFMFLSGDEDAGRMIKAAQLISRATENVYVISHAVVSRDTQDHTIQALELPANRVLHLPCRQHLAAFTDVLLPQLISARLPALMGRARHEAVSQIGKDMQTKYL